MTISKKMLFLFLLIFSLQACASKQVQDTDAFLDFDDYEEEQTSDPLEGYNRAMHAFNDFLLLQVVKPIHKGYSYVVPQKLRSGLANFADNLLFPVRFINALLQFEFGGATIELGHFLINSMTSLGFADVASTKEDYFYYNADAYNFNVTLAKWGVAEGPPIVLPFFGPNTLRGAFGLGVDSVSDPMTYVLPVAVTFAEAGLNFNTIDSVYLPYEKLKEISLDPYIGIRDATLSMQRTMIDDYLNRTK